MRGSITLRACYLRSFLAQMVLRPRSREWQDSMKKTHIPPIVNPTPGGETMGFSSFAGEEIGCCLRLPFQSFSVCPTKTLHPRFEIPFIPPPRRPLRNNIGLLHEGWLGWNFLDLFHHFLGTTVTTDEDHPSCLWSRSFAPGSGERSFSWR